MSFLAIDLGTSFIKGAVLNLETCSLSHTERMPFPAPVPGLPPLFHEIEPDRIVTAVKALIDRLLSHAPACSGLVLSSQMHGLVLTNTRGEPRSNFISWKDQRVLTRYGSGPGTYYEMLSR